MLKEYCEKFNLDYDEVMKYKNANPELNDYEVLFHFKTNIHVNILGKIIEC
jgi:hypothetical protein